MSDVKIYSISNEYVSHLKADPRLRNVFQNKPERHIRKYLGVVLQRGEFSYFVPFSSPKDTDYMQKSSTIRKPGSTLYMQTAMRPGI